MCDGDCPVFNDFYVGMRLLLDLHSERADWRDAISHAEINVAHPASSSYSDCAMVVSPLLRLTEGVRAVCASWSL